MMSSHCSAAVKKPVRILNVNVVCAYDLLKMDILGKSDPYVKLSLSGEGLPSKKTSIKMRNLNPEWNEQFKLIVKDPETLDVLFPHETKEFTVDLLKNMNPNDPQNKRNRGKIVLHLTFDPFKEDTGTFSKVLEEKLSSIDSGIQDASGNGGLLLVIVEAAEDVEGKHHTNPYAVVLLRGEKKKTKVQVTVW
ncbi:synaptotagmin-3-like [Zingiber officinale]|uniref:synaptotagmin-3-like n=1 Tax=Zingiber officinale TaxID=94328 RepID=UPI001C4B3C65|nr:synaptotagmin-3-like [Zingiber officinale]XP_042467888.1 synaptotagmin-3-like [Zingiber officinale]XP_042467889.1 synaptotagmin-3-like [Zingiber officinale]XP_042467890.1 synaptotagmin-3-like [Zingiber officinale]XP_042467891.1 synaptotagmin-3-like [Zingiber officinale]